MDVDDTSAGGSLVVNRKVTWLGRAVIFAWMPPVLK
jgi:hypothetical protein